MKLFSKTKLKKKLLSLGQDEGISIEILIGCKKMEKIVQDILF